MARRIARAGHDIEMVLSNPKCGRCASEHPRDAPRAGILNADGTYFCGARWNASTRLRTFANR